MGILTKHDIYRVYLCYNLIFCDEQTCHKHILIQTSSIVLCISNFKHSLNIKFVWKKNVTDLWVVFTWGASSLKTARPSSSSSSMTGHWRSHVLFDPFLQHDNTEFYWISFVWPRLPPTRDEVSHIRRINLNQQRGAVVTTVS